MRTRTIIIAEEGKVITNGTDYGTTIVLAEGADASNYYEISKAEYEKILAEESDFANEQLL